MHEVCLPRPRPCLPRLGGDPDEERRGRAAAHTARAAGTAALLLLVLLCCPAAGFAAPRGEAALPGTATSGGAAAGAPDAALGTSGELAAGEPPASDTELLFFGEALVELASRSPEPMRTAPSMVTVLTREQLRSRGWETLGELLAALPGFTVATDGWQKQVYSRGLKNSLLLMVDGVPLISDAERTELLLDERLDLASVARVEVVRGPVSSLWGPGAATGVVNLITLDDTGLRGGEAEAAAGTSGHSLARGRTAGRLGPLGYLLAGSVRWRDRAAQSYDHVATRFVATPQGWVPTTFAAKESEAMPGRFAHLQGRLRYGAAWLGASLADHLDHSPLSSFSQALLPADQTERHSGRELTLRAGTAGSWQPCELRAIGFVRRQERGDDIPLFPRSAAQPAGGAIRLDSTFWQAGGWLQGKLGNPRHRLTLGTQGHYDATAVGSQVVEPLQGARSPGVQRKASSVVLSAFAQYRFTPQLRLPLQATVGTSLDKHSDFSASINPRAALVLEPLSWLTVKLLYGEALRTPDQYDMLALAGASFLGRLDQAEANPELRPEKVRTGELGLRLESGWLLLDISLYSSWADDLIRTQREGRLVRARNVGGRRILGGEAAFEARLPRSFAGRLGAHVLRAWDLEGEAVHEMPEQALHAGLGWQPLGWLGFDLDSLLDLADDGAGADGAHLLLHGQLRMGRGPVQLALRLRNILDEQSRQPGRPSALPGLAVLVPGEPRSLLLLLSGKL